MAGGPYRIKEEMEMSMAEELVPGSCVQSQEHLVIAGEEPVKFPFPWVSAPVPSWWGRCVYSWADSYICMYVFSCMCGCVCVCALVCIYMYLWFD